MKKDILKLSVLATLLPLFANAADYSDDIHKNDYSWSQFNLMYAFDELPGESSHDYLEMEFGGRSGIFDLYGYVDIFNLANDSGSDKAGSPKMYMKFAPHISLDALTGKDLSFGPVKELFIATEFNWEGGDYSDGTKGTQASFWGLGSDVTVPFLGDIGVNLYALYDLNIKDWNGYQLSLDWFTPLHTFENGSFISYQGYIDYQFATEEKSGATADHGGQMFNGFYWHTDRYAIGYGLKAYNDVYGIKDGTWGLKTSGISHYASVTYKF